MSQWTHVNAIFRLDSSEKIEDEEIISIFGKAIDYEHMGDVEYDEDCNVKNIEQYLPMGSEGTLEINIWHNPHKSDLASTTVSVFGDLRDYASFEEIEKWFNRCCDIFAIRQAVCQVNIEFCGTKVFQREWDYT